jgi:hypothetical protein
MRLIKGDRGRRVWASGAEDHPYTVDYVHRAGNHHRVRRKMLREYEKTMEGVGNSGIQCRVPI